MGLGVPSSWLERMILPTGGGLGFRHSQQSRDWASLRSAFLPRGGLRLCHSQQSRDCARPGGLRIPSLLAGGALAEMNRCAGSTPVFCVPPSLLQASLHRFSWGTKKPEDFHLPVHFCGEGGIRTPGSSQINGFQDRRNRPLCHLSKPLLSLWDCKCTNKILICKF